MHHFSRSRFFKIIQISSVALYLFTASFSVTLAQEEETPPDYDPRFPDVEVIDVSSQEAIDNLSEEEKAALAEMGATGDGQTDGAEQPLSCFDYYTFNSVQVQAGPEIDSTVPGSPLSITGTIQNENPYPLVDAQVHAKVFKVSGEETNAAMANGDPLVGFFTMADDLTVPANGELPFQYEFDVPQYAADGDYQMAFFVTVADRYNMLGLSFTDDVLGNTTDFSIESERSAVPTFDKNSVTLNGQSYEFANLSPHFASDEVVTMEADVVNPLDTAASVTLNYTLYNWDGLREENVQDTHSEVIELAPGETRRVSYEVPAIDHAVSYVVADLVYEDTHSVLNPRFVRDGIEETRINFPGVTNYPLQEGETNTLFSCLHSISEGGSEGSLDLTLTTPDGETIYSNTYEGQITGAMMATAGQFTPDSDYTDFDINATLRDRNGEEVESVTLEYRCEELRDNCPETAAAGANGDPSKDKTILYIIGAVLALIIVVLLLLILKKSGIIAILALAILGSSGAYLAFDKPTAMAGGGGSEKTHTKGHAFTSNPYSQNARNKSVLVTSNTRSTGELDIPNTGWWFKVRRVQAKAVYRARVNVSEGTIHTGTSIRVSHPRRNRDISFYIRGTTYDTPYGCWTDKRHGAWNCTNTYLGRNNNMRAYYGVVVRPPNYSVRGTGAISCSGNSCQATRAGSGTITISYPRSYAYTYLRARTVSTGSNRYLRTPNLRFPSRTLRFRYTVEDPNSPPNVSLTCPSTLKVNENGSFKVSGTDPDNDSVRYAIDWDNNGSNDQFVPSNGYVNSGTTQNVNHSFGSSGSYTIQARTQDSNSSWSNWTSCTVNVVSPPTVDLTADENVVIYGSDTTLRWDVSNADSCNASDDWGGSKSTAGGSESTGPLTEGANYVLSCSGDGGTVHDSVKVEVETGTDASIENTSCNPVVRHGSQCDLEWDVGTSEPSTCSIAAGDNTISGYSSLTEPTGTLSVTVEGETEYILDCPGNTDTERIRVLPKVQEV